VSGILQQSAAVCCWCKGPLVQLVSDPGTWWCITPKAEGAEKSCAQKQLAWGLSRDEWIYEGNKPVGVKKERLFIPTPRQVEYLASPAKYRLFGGAAGPGKSHAARMGLYRRALAIPKFAALILRESFPELEKTHLRKMGEEAEWFGAEFIESKRLLRFANGSLIECGHLDDERAVRKYLSTEYDHIVADEGTLYDENALLEVSTRARTSKPAVMAAGGARFDVVTNPGGPSAQMLTDFFLDHAPDPEKYPVLAKNFKPEQWAFIPATLDDNPYLDPEYVESLAVLQPWRYKQLRFGDFRVTHGQFFTQWSTNKHVREVAIDEPAKATWYRALDWGYHDPTVVGWYVALPDGHYHKAAELKLKEHTIDEVVREVKAMDRTLGLPTPISTTRTYADPNTRQRQGQTGESILETFGKCGMPLIPAVNERKNGWMRVQALLKDAPDGIPWLTFAPECKYTHKCISGVLSDEKDPDEVNEKQADLQHGLDETRYFVMSRPMPNAPQTKAATPPGTAGHLLDEAIAEAAA
jgi:hypothetical protein